MLSSNELWRGLLSKNCVTISPRFDSLCISPSIGNRDDPKYQIVDAFCQGWNRMEITLNLGLMGHSARVIKPLDEATAVKTGVHCSRLFSILGVASKI